MAEFYIFSGLCYTIKYKICKPLIAEQQNNDSNTLNPLKQTTKKTADSNEISNLINALKDANNVVRYQAAAELGALAIRLLFNLFIATLGDRDWQVCYCAAEALGEILPLLNLLLGVLKNDKDAMLRRQAAQSLGEIGDPVLSGRF